MGIKRNYVYNSVYRLLIMFLPIITVPYISRVLGSEGVGISSYTNSIVQYFLLAGTLGVSLYGPRTIAYVRDDKSLLSKTFWEIFIVIGFACIISTLAFLIYIFESRLKYRTIYLAQTLNLVGTFLDTSWFFTGLEEFKKLVSRNVVVRILSVILIFSLIKHRSDVGIYVLLLGGTSIVSSLLMLVYLPRYVSVPNLASLHPFRHFGGLLKLFIPQIAIQIYVVLNKTMLGILTTPSEVGVFAQSEKIINMSLAIITSMGTVMLPRISNTLARKDLEKTNFYLIKAFQFASFLSIPMAFGWIGISNNFVPWFFGQEFTEAKIVIPILSCILIAIAWSNVMGIQFMIPLGEEKKFGLTVTLGAIVSLGLNLLLIPRFKASGAAIATTITEFCVTGFQVYLMHNRLPIKEMFSELIKYASSALIMLGGIELFNNIGLSFNGLFMTLVQILGGLIIYLMMLFVFRSSLFLETMLMIKVQKKPKAF